MKKLTKKSLSSIKGGSKNFIIDDIIITPYTSKGDIVIDDLIVLPYRK